MSLFSPLINEYISIRFAAVEQFGSGLYKKTHSLSHLKDAIFSMTFKNEIFFRLFNCSECDLFCSTSLEHYVC